MRVLLDECIPRKLRRYLAPHECATVQELGWAGRRNGQLLAAAEGYFDVLLTVDRNLPFQQSLASRRLSILIIDVRSNRLEELKTPRERLPPSARPHSAGEVLRV